MTTPPPSRRDDPTPRALTVLLVDAHDHGRATLAAVLTRLGHRTLAASTCAAARDLAATHGVPTGGGGPRLVDLVIGDERLPDGDGVTLVEELRSAFACDTVVVLTGRAGDAEVDGDRPVAGMAPGVRRLVKPVEVDHLVAVLADAASR